MSSCPLRNWGTIRPGRMSVSFSGNLPARMRRRKTAARRALESISVAPWVASGVGRSMFPSPPKPRAQPTQEGRNQESSNWYQHLWLRPQPATSTFEEESSHDDGSPDPHVGNKGSQHDEDCSHYPLDHERKRIRECGLVACLQSVWKNVGGLRSKRTEQRNTGVRPSRSVYESGTTSTGKPGDRRAHSERRSGPKARRVFAHQR